LKFLLGGHCQEEMLSICNIDNEQKLSIFFFAILPNVSEKLFASALRPQKIIPTTLNPRLTPNLLLFCGAAKDPKV
jgi:hypothetical protein